MDYTSVGSSFSFSSMSDKNLLHSEAECWLKAEKAAQDVLSVVQPTVLSYKKRLEIVSYVRELIRDIVGDEVMAFGSTPLKTYLPDGDIDLTVITSQNDVAYLVSSVCSILEEQICDSSPIKNVQVVDARDVVARNSTCLEALCRTIES